MPRKLAAVPRGTKAPQPAPVGVYASAEHSERALLVALRTCIAKEIDAGVPPAYLASLAKQVREVDREVRALDQRDTQEAASVGGIRDETWSAV